MKDNSKDISIGNSSESGLVDEPDELIAPPVQQEPSTTQPSQKQPESTKEKTSSTVHSKTFDHGIDTTKKESDLLLPPTRLHNTDNDIDVGVGLVGKSLILKQEDEERHRSNGGVVEEAVAGSPDMERNQLPRAPGAVITTETVPPQLRRDLAKVNTLPGAVAVQGIQQQQDVAYSSSSESESESSMNDDPNNDASDLVEAEAVDDVEQPQAVAHPSTDGTHRRETITRKYQVRLAGFLLLLLLGCGIIIGSICGAGLCGSSNDSNEPSKTSRDILQAPKMESAITGILGQDYFDGAEESGEGNDHDLTDFLMETRQKAFNWIVNQDPRQLEYDTPNWFRDSFGAFLLLYHEAQAMEGVQSVSNSYGEYIS
ncbi:expressed unknown protein [Seminavis robusta]|uniref:Uncharacterized protein n=1 Tax=Seminavis robusta TaxID=568900 RepID=A0A9N8E0C8_9STRA|nr:expressed unknown protein [Seminavis robusta]|eukprot:Sro409_g137270.1 n/a (371) ;mRNA; f:62222-63334